MLVKVLFALALIAAASANINFTPCPGITPPNWFVSTMCTLAGVCTLTRGSIFTGRAEVTAVEHHATLNVQLSATLLGINFPLTIAPGFENACIHLEDGHTCPIVVGQTSVWAMQFPVNTTYPAISGLNIRMAAGENPRSVACAMVTGNIV